MFVIFFEFFMRVWKIINDKLVNFAVCFHIYVGECFGNDFESFYVGMWYNFFAFGFKLELLMEDKTQ